MPACMQPNILFILIDDMGWRDLSCYGSAFYETPCIDRLASEGMLFTQAYAASPVCSPTRASLLSGKYPARVGVTNYIGGQARGRLIDAPYVDHLPLSEFSLARALQEGGYQTWHVGKWHLGGQAFFPEQHGFAVNRGGCHFGHPVNGYFAPWGIETLDESEDGTYLTDRLTDEAIRLICSRQSGENRPFFLNLWHYAVHTPIQAPEDQVSYYRQKAARLKLDAVDPIVVGEFFPCDHKKDQRVTRRILQSDPDYAAMIANLDANIGRLTDVLAREGILDDTVIIFTSDNGGLSSSEGAPTCNAPLAEGKGWMYEGGVREPLIIRYPGLIQAGSVCDTAVTSPDFYPTLLDLAGLPRRPGQHLDGVSMMPLLEAGHAGSFERSAIFWHFPHYGNQGGTPAASVRRGPWKLIHFFEDDRLELYHLDDDISEVCNLADRMSDLAAELDRILLDWLAGVGARLPARA